jgi:uncharacterized protein involved in exopolysaccharide biosynthesis
MPDIFYLVSKWWKQMLSIITISLVAAAVILYFLPSKYLSISTALPASSYSVDKASIFSENIQSLYPAVGEPDDLDKIIGTAQLDTVYIAVAGEFNLYDHYKVAELGDAALSKAAWLLKLNTRVIKSDFGELRVKVWDTDKNLAPQLANAIMDKLQAIHEDLQNSNNISILKNIRVGKEKLQSELDSIPLANTEKYAVTRAALSAQLQQYEKLINQYQLMIESKTPVLIILEKARVSGKADKPKRLEILIATFVLSLLFAFLLALLLERRKVLRK